MKHWRRNFRARFKFH
ncbi:MAG: hypothetical protein H0W77_06440, partial [Acidobacteria bacterium]|nr:hypothetical protein [Acidobacteriota bacterium]